MALAINSSVNDLVDSLPDSHIDSPRETPSDYPKETPVNPNPKGKKPPCPCKKRNNQIPIPNPKLEPPQNRPLPCCLQNDKKVNSSVLDDKGQKEDKSMLGRIFTFGNICIGLGVLATIIAVIAFAKHAFAIRK